MAKVTCIPPEPVLPSAEISLSHEELVMLLAVLKEAHPSTIADWLVRTNRDNIPCHAITNFINNLSQSLENVENISKHNAYCKAIDIEV